ncbi:unnamed protein product [Urochloa humidicola]
MVRRAGGVQRRGTSTKPTSCSGEIDWIAGEHDEPKQASEHIEDEELEGTVSFKRRRAWSQEENDILIEMVNAHSSKDWLSIARAVPGRTRKQCRDRRIYYCSWLGMTPPPSPGPHDRTPPPAAPAPAATHSGPRAAVPLLPLPRCGAPLLSSSLSGSPRPNHAARRPGAGGHPLRPRAVVPLSGPCAAVPLLPLTRCGALLPQRHIRWPW